MLRNFLLISFILVLFQSCRNAESEYDATGTFEANDVIVSTGATGKIIQFNIDEGMELKANQIIGIVDTEQLYLKKLQVQAQIKAVLSKQPNINSQIAAYQEQIKTANKEKNRAQNLLNAGAGTQKQLDDINAQIEVLQKQLDAVQTSLEITSQGISSEVAPLTYQIAQIDDQLVKSYVLNPVNGTVLTKYVEQGEFNTPGKSMYKVADLTNMTLRAYITGDQLGLIKLNQKVAVFVDHGADAYKEMEGTVYWISDKAEFTPKSIQTKEERANLVYAIKIKVPNDGSIKIGMYGEIKFKAE